MPKRITEFARGKNVVDHSRDIDYNIEGRSFVLAR